MEALQLDLIGLAFILFAGFITAVLHGATGMAGGLVMAAVLSLMIGVKAAIPAMTVALIISHGTRAWLNFKSADIALATRVLLYAAPGIALGSWLFGYLSETAVALIMAGFLIASFPIKRYTNTKNIRANNLVLGLGSGLWGLLAGNVVGPGFVLAPFLQATGMNRHTFVATLACIVLFMNAVKTGVFLTTGLSTQNLVLLGVLIGLATIPGNYVGRAILRRMTDRDHTKLIDLMTVLIIFNFLYIALQAR